MSERTLCGQEQGCLGRAGARGMAWVLCIATALTMTGALCHPATPAEAQEVIGRLYHCKPGPWGKLEYYHVYLEPPDRLWQQVVLPESLTKWNFPGGTEGSVRAVFEKAGLSLALQNHLLNPGQFVRKDDVLTVFPPLPDVLAMTPEQRVILYSELGKSSLNHFCADPIRIVDGDPATWLAESALRPELREAVKRLLYKRGEVLCLSDIPAVIAMTRTESEAQAAVKAIWRTRALVLQLNLKTSSDFAGTLRYWSGAPPTEEIGSIIQPAANVEGEKRLDCAHLLPPLPRRHLYRYPSQDLMASSQEPDCNWTAMNFFNTSPFAYHYSGPMIEQRLNDAYTPVPAPYRFGDLLLLLEPPSRFVHSCVFLADDIVYTKNGKGRLRPWLLMKLGDLTRYYAFDRPIIVQGFRLKMPPDEDR